MSRHVAVLMGGWSAERQVSLISGAAVSRALNSAGYQVTSIDVRRDAGALLTRLYPRPDAVFNALQGFRLKQRNKFFRFTPEGIKQDRHFAFQIIRIDPPLIQSGSFDPFSMSIGRSEPIAKRFPITAGQEITEIAPHLLQYLLFRGLVILIAILLSTSPSTRCSSFAVPSVTDTNACVSPR